MTPYLTKADAVAVIDASLPGKRRRAAPGGVGLRVFPTPGPGSRDLRAMDMHLHLHDGLHALIREVAEQDGVSVEAAVVTAVEDFVASRQTRRIPEQSRKTVEQDAPPPHRPAE
jgi:hypothetical protein